MGDLVLLVVGAAGFLRRGWIEKKSWNIFLWKSRTTFWILQKRIIYFTSALAIFIGAHAIRILDARPLYHQSSKPIFPVLESGLPEDLSDLMVIMVAVLE